MNLYPEEMNDITHAIRALSTYVESISYSEIELDLPPSLAVVVRSRNNGRTLGTIDYTDDGAIGFITWEK